MPCFRCLWPYPSDLLTPMHFVGNFISSLTKTQPICGICALEISNELHRTHRTQFDGEIAEDMRQQALIWRRRHPHCDPARKKAKKKPS